MIHHRYFLLPDDEVWRLVMGFCNVVQIMQLDVKCSSLGLRQHSAAFQPSSEIKAILLNNDGEWGDAWGRRDVMLINALRDSNSLIDAT